MLLPRQLIVKQKTLKFLNSDDLRPGVVVGPTGFGKSYLISAIANEYKEPILVLQPTKELLEQNLEKLRLIGGNATVYSASMGVKELSKLTYATLGSIKKEVRRLKELGVKTVLIDECDFGYSRKEGSEFNKFIKALQPKKIVGYTATPFYLTTQGNRFGDSVSYLKMINRVTPKIFKHFIDIVQIQEVIESDMWSDLVYIKHNFDTKLLEYNTAGSEFTENSIREAVKTNNVNNSIYLRVKDLLVDKNKKILVFVDSLETGEKFSNLFNGKSYFLCGSTTKKLRSKYITDFRDMDSGVQIIFNHSVLTTGFDFPELNHIMIGRPTNSLRLYYQMIGRGVRKHVKKLNCMVEDLCGNIDRFGYIEDLTIENYGKHGWTLFNKDTVLTNVPLDSPIKITKSNIDNLVHNKTKLWFGKYKNVSITEVGKGYLVYLTDWINSLSTPSENLVALQKEITKVLNS